MLLQWSQGSLDGVLSLRTYAVLFQPVVTLKGAHRSVGIVTKIIVRLQRSTFEIGVTERSKIRLQSPHRLAVRT
jgi:hypothetical protein